MNIIKEQNDNLSLKINVSIDETDYKERVKKELNKLRGKVQMPGFRQGHVPAGLIQKMYGQAVLVDEINKILQESVGQFLEDEKIDLLGAPFPSEDTPAIDFENDKKFNFVLNVILAPQASIDFLKTLPTTYYKIKATDKLIDEQITALRQRFGNMEDSNDLIKDRDYLRCDYQSLSDKNIQSHSFFFIDEKVNPWSTQFLKHKVNDTLELDIDKTFDGDIDRASAMLNLPEENKEQAKGIFKFTITEVKRKKEVEINEDLFKKAFPDKEIKTEKVFRDTIAAAHSEMCGESVDMWFFNTNFDSIIEKANLHYDDNLLRQYILHQKRTNNNHQHDESQSCEQCENVTDAEFEGIKRGTTWQLIQQKLMDTYNIRVEVEEVRQAAKEQISQYFGIDPKLVDVQLGDYINNMVDNIMKDKDQVKNLYDRTLDKKLTQVLKENTKVTTKEITWDEFIKIAEAKKEEETEKPAKKEPKEPATKKAATPKKPKNKDSSKQSLFE